MRAQLDDQRIAELLQIRACDESFRDTLDAVQKISPCGMHIATYEEYLMLQHVIDPVIQRMEEATSSRHKTSVYVIWVKPIPILNKRPGVEEDPDVDYKLEGYHILIPDTPGWMEIYPQCEEPDPTFDPYWL